jgi:hypothetical protein
MMSYLVRENETLGEILHTLNYSPLWGPRGFVRQAWLLNQGTVENEGDLIRAGVIILLPTVSRTIASVDGESINGRAFEPSPGLAHSDAPHEQAGSKIEESGVSHGLSFSLGYGLTSISASDPMTGASARLLSSRDVRLSGAWEQGWSPQFSTFFRFEISSEGFEQSTNPSESLTSASNTPVELAFGTKFHWRGLTMTPELAYGDRLFVRGLSSNAITVDSVAVLSAGLSGSIELYRRQTNSVGVQGAAAFLGGASTDAYSVRSGSYLEGGAYLDKTWGPFGAHSLRLDIGYESSRQNTSIVDQDEKSVVSSLTLRFPLLGGE